MIATIAALALVSAPEKLFVSCERFGYIGTVSVYNSFAEAQSGRNPRYSNLAVPQRGGSIYMAKAMGGEYGEFNAFLTNWYSTTDPNPEQNVGKGNPHNTNVGFLQIYDNNADNWQNQTASWNKTKNVFTFESKGKNASYPSQSNPGEYARLWNAGAPNGSGEATKGTYLQYEIKFVASGIVGTDGDNDGFIEYQGNNGTYSGYYRAIFRNESERFPASNGWYVVNVTFNNDCWAVTNGVAKPNHFGSAKVQ